MEKTSYDDLVEFDYAEHKACPFNWECDTCTENLCIRLIGVAELPSLYGDFKILAFYNNKDKKDHIAVVKGDVVNQENVLTRLHSSCLTGDSLGSHRCDCGPQLHTSLALMEQEELGILLYMQQEGRGIGLANKIKAYQLQDIGFDTFDANLHLGFVADARDYEVSAAMIEKLKIKSIRLLTNNLNKIMQLKKYNVNINEQVPLELPFNAYNFKYLLTKKERFNHKLRLEIKENID